MGFPCDTHENAFNHTSRNLSTDISQLVSCFLPCQGFFCAGCLSMSLYVIQSLCWRRATPNCKKGSLRLFFEKLQKTGPNPASIRPKNRSHLKMSSTGRWLEVFGTVALPERRAEGGPEAGQKREEAVARQSFKPPF